MFTQRKKPESSLALPRSIYNVLRRKPAYHDPDEALFAKLHFQLFVWSSCVLGSVLLVLVVLLSAVTPRIFTYFTTSDLSMQAEHIKQHWQANPSQPCPIPSTLTSYMIVCFDAHGKTITTGETPPSADFLRNPLNPLTAKEATYTQDYFASKDGTTEVYRYATVVPAANGHSILGTLQIGIITYNQQIIAIITFLISGVVLIIIIAPITSIAISRRAIAPARLAFKRQQTFIANASHELNTPLALLRADAEVLLHSHNRMEAEDVELLEDIIAESTFMTTLANNMLTLARIDAGEQHLEQDLIDMKVLVNGLARRVRSRMAAQHLELDIHAENSIFILGDTLQIEQTILILLDNAIKYNRPAGKIAIALKIASNRMHLSISDTGIGIAPEHLPQIGNRFYRIDKARSRESGGNGLGLSIARSIIHAHKGELIITSQIEQGTNVTLVLPILKHQQKAER